MTPFFDPVCTALQCTVYYLGLYSSWVTSQGSNKCEQCVQYRCDQSETYVLVTQASRQTQTDKDSHIQSGLYRVVNLAK